MQARLGNQPRLFFHGEIVNVSKMYVRTGGKLNNDPLRGLRLECQLLTVKIECDSVF